MMVARSVRARVFLQRAALVAWLVPVAIIGLTGRVIAVVAWTVMVLVAATIHLKMDRSRCAEQVRAHANEVNAIRRDRRGHLITLGLIVGVLLLTPPILVATGFHPW